MGKRFVFVVDTDSYAGSFEREICGYLTGRFDDPPTHGDVEAEIAWRELPAETKEYFDGHVMICLEQPDDVPTHTPVVIWPTPGWFNHGMGGHFRDGQEKEAFEDYKREVEKYKKEHKDSTLEASPRLHKCPAYMSVGIFFDERPPDAVIAVLKARALAFAKDYWPNHKTFGHPLQVTGFRILEEVVGTVEERV